MSQPDDRNYMVREDDVIVDDIVLETTVGGKTSILGSVSSIGLFEDIFTPFMTGQLVLADGNNLTQKLPINGREIITISYRTPLNGNRKVVRMRICGQLSRSKTTESRTDLLELRLISEMGYENNLIRFSKSFKGKYSDIVTEICRDTFSANVQVEETNGKAVVVFPFMHPDQMILQMATDSISVFQDNKIQAAGYCFFETATGLKFRSLHSLMKQAPDPRKYYINSEVQRKAEDSDNLEFSTHIPRTVSVPRNFDRLNQIENGGFSNVQHFYDITTKTWGATKFTYSSDSDISLSDQDFINPIISVKESESFIPSRYTMLERTTQRHTDVPESDFRFSTSKFTRSNFTLYDDTQVKINVQGDSDLEAGKTVNLFLTKNDVDPIVTEDETDSNLSGVFLIKGLQHRFIFPNDGSITMKTSMNLVRNYKNTPIPTETTINDTAS